MSIVTFWSNGKEQTGKSISLAAISTHMAIEHNLKILVVSTSADDMTLPNCFFAKKNAKTMTFGMFAPRQGNMAMKSGVEGLVRMARSNKVTPEMVRNYTRTVFKGTLEILYLDNEDDTENKESVSSYYPDIIRNANQYYDIVFVDLDNDLDEDSKKEIMQDSEVIVTTVTQRQSSIDRLIKDIKEDEILSNKKTMPLIGRYDMYSKFTAKNLARYLGESEPLPVIPYSTLMYDSAEDAGLPDLFLNFVKSSSLEKDERNNYLFSEIKKAIDGIQEKIREAQLNI